MSVLTHTCPFCKGEMFKVYYCDTEKWRCFECSDAQQRLLADGCHDCNKVEWCETGIGYDCRLRQCN